MLRLLLLFSSCLAAKRILTTTPIRQNLCFTPGQKIYWNALNSKDTSMVVGTGPAGCGKTLLACTSAVQHLREGSVKKIVLTRPVVSVADENLGYLPGSVSHKMDPWMRPLYDVLGEHFTTKEVNTMIHDGIIEIAPLGFMRGRTFKDAWIVADEMQNSTPVQTRMIATRVGEGSKLVMTGDLAQSDLGPGVYNGLAEFIDLWRSSAASSHTSIQCVELGFTDVKRSKVVADVLAMYSSRKGI
jgi:phosphate starvation-inducible PhoH-like protein